MQSFKPSIRTSLGALALATISLCVHAAAVPGQGTWETTLKARDTNGDSVVDAYYDTALDITWLADWNVKGVQSWGAATAWAAGLNLYGKTGWRLPSTTDTGSPGCDFSNAGGTDCGYNVDTASSEMAHMFYVTLGNKAFCPPGDATCAGGPQPGWGLTNTANFINMQSSYYYSGTSYAPSSIFWAWHFYNRTGYQAYADKREPWYAVAVRPGDVVAVPEPQTTALMLVGLAALIAVRRQRR